MLKKSGAWGRGGGGVQGGYEQRIEVIVKIAKTKLKVEGGGGGPVQGWGGGQSGCERRIKVIVKMQNEKKGWGGVLFEEGGGVEELNLCGVGSVD